MKTTQITRHWKRAAAFAVIALALPACSGNDAQINTMEDEIAMRQDRIGELEQEMQEQKRLAQQAAQRAEDAERRAREAAQNAAGTTTTTTSMASMSSDDLLPPNAEPGECYARVLTPEVYETTEERVLVSEASSRIEIIPAEYEMVDERVVVKEASTKLEIIPATYEWVEERVLVKPASSRLEKVPAVYTTETERVLVTPARTYWKKGRGPIERVDNATGEIMCLIEEPAVYKDISRKVLKTAEATREVEIPAEYKTVKRQVVKTPATTREVTIPAQYETVRVRQVKTPARQVRKEIPAEYRTVTKRTMVKDSVLEWRPVVCETNMNGALVRDLQSALKKAGHDPGPVDGRYGPKTSEAIASYQRAKGLPTGGLTYRTMESLGLKFGG